jgi:hypothetical protein
VIHEPVVLGEPFAVGSRTAFCFARYAVVNNRHVIVEPHTRRVIKIID